MTPEQAAALRAPFPPEMIGKLPRRNKDGGSTMLDYVGHADVTDRLIRVDPDWNWEPLSVDDDGLPRFNRTSEGVPFGLWIRLTICGVTRLGYGSVPPNAFDPEKQLIGDALRNAALRFGVALEQWSKSDWHEQGDTDTPVQRRPQSQQARPPAPVAQTTEPAPDRELAPLRERVEYPWLTAFNTALTQRTCQPHTVAEFLGVDVDGLKPAVDAWIREHRKPASALVIAAVDWAINRDEAR